MSCTFCFRSDGLIPFNASGISTYVEMPLALKGIKPSERKQKVQDMLKRVGLENHAAHYPNELSGGQQQRVSIFGK